MKISDLNEKHPYYDEDLMARLGAYYRGGIHFPISKELRSKPVESDPKIGSAIRASREQCACYTNYFGDTILDMACQVVAEPIDINSTNSYYSGLNKNANGKRGGMNEQVRASVIDDMLYGRAFYLVKFPHSEADKRKQQEAEGGLDATISSISAEYITDWEEGDDGKLLWAKLYETFQKRAGPGEKAEQWKRWIIYTEDSIVTYEAPPNSKDDADITPMIYDHGLGVCPVFIVSRALDVSIGAKLLPTAYQLFNEESDASYYRFTTVTGGLFIFTNNPSKFEGGITLSPFGAVLLGETDKIDRDRADPAVMMALEDATKSRRSQLGGLIYTMARQSAAQAASGQNTSRASGASLEQQEGPLKVFERGFADAQISVIKLMLNVIAKVRDEEDTEIVISGLINDVSNEYDPVTTDRVEAEAAFSALQYVPEDAKRIRGARFAIEAVPDVDDETREKIAKGVEPKPENEPALEPIKPGRQENI